MRPWLRVCVRTCKVCISICSCIEFSSQRSVTWLGLGFGSGPEFRLGFDPN